MRIPSLLIFTTSLACAAPGEVSGLRAEFDELKEKQRIDNDDLDKKLTVELEQLHTEIAALKKNQGELATKLNGIDEGSSQPSQPNQPDHKTYAVSVGSSPIKGPDDAWVTIVEFAEYQCPYCARIQPTLDALLKKYGNDLRVVFKHNPLPFHNNAIPAAIASGCAHKQRAFWPMHKILFENPRALHKARLISYARRAGNLNFAKWKKCFEEKEVKESIKEDQDIAARFGVRGTPAFFINGRFLSGAQPMANFEELIDEELVKAKASGIARGAYYETMVLGKGEKKL